MSVRPPLALLACLCLAACGGPKEPVPATNTPSSPSQTKDPSTEDTSVAGGVDQPMPTPPERPGSPSGNATQVPGVPAVVAIEPVPYPGSKKWGNYADQRTEGPEATIDTMMRTTADSLDKVAEFYATAMPVRETGTLPNQRILTGSAPGGYIMAVTLKRVDGLTQITVVVSKARE